VSLSALRTRADTFGSGANAFTIGFVDIGNPGNADDAGAGKRFTIFSRSHDNLIEPGRKLNAMKPFLVSAFAFLILATASTHAASDADVTLFKVKKVVIEESVITIVAEAKTRITLIRDGYDPAYTGDNWHGMPVTVVQVISNEATFTINRPADRLPNAWQESLKAAKDLQEGKEVGRIGFYAPDIVIKGNMIDSITGFGFLYPKRK
jgi:hypothetical protein